MGRIGKGALKGINLPPSLPTWLKFKGPEEEGVRRRKAYQVGSVARWCPEQEDGKGSPSWGTAGTCPALGPSLLAGFRSSGFVIFLIAVPAPHSAQHTVTAPQMVTD